MGSCWISALISRRKLDRAVALLPHLGEVVTVKPLPGERYDVGVGVVGVVVVDKPHPRSAGLLYPLHHVPRPVLELLAREVLARGEHYPVGVVALAPLGVAVGLVLADLVPLAVETHPVAARALGVGPVAVILGARPHRGPHPAPRGDVVGLDNRAAQLYVSRSAPAAPSSEDRRGGVSSRISRRPSTGFLRLSTLAFQAARFLALASSGPNSSVKSWKTSLRAAALS